MRPRPTARAALLLAALHFGCGGAPPRPAPPPAPPEVVEMEPLRIEARRGEGGDVHLEAYDAETLFRRGTEALDAGRCEEAIAAYERLADAFPESRWLSAALYNAGWCALQGREHERAAAFYERLLRERPDSPDATDARFQLAAALFELRRWERLRRVAEALLDTEGLEPDERIEAMGYRAQALLGIAEARCEAERAGEAEPNEAGAHGETSGAVGARESGGGARSGGLGGLLGSLQLRPRERVRELQGLDCRALLQEVEREARRALSLGRLQEQRGEPVGATAALAASSYALGESYRLRAEAIEVPAADPATQHEVLEERARLTLEAQRFYTDTVRWGVPRWSAPAGYRIGALYDGLWAAIDRAPVPPPRRPLRPAAERFYYEEYRRQLRARIRPLLRHAVRYWELTLLMIERTGAEGPWAQKVREGLQRVRARLLETSASASEPERERSGARREAEGEAQ